MIVYNCFPGEVGSATSMKLVINTLYGAMLAGLAETLALGEKVGLQQEMILEILGLLPIASPLIASKGDGTNPSIFSDFFTTYP
jgi:3-hydroxyisobutyrate dehydrogenase-like beta-hydroxyacid dehydrogenase